MKIKPLLVTGMVSVLTVAPAIHAQTPMSTAFTYQGQLKQAGEPVNNTADLEFTLWDAPADGSQVGDMFTVSDLVVMGGQFTVQLDFGAEVFNGEARWLEVAVRVPHDPSDAAPYTTLGPRHELTAVPCALQTRGLYVDDGGNVGIGTTDPQHSLSVGGATADVQGVAI